MRPYDIGKVLAILRRIKELLPNTIEQAKSESEYIFANLYKAVDECSPPAYAEECVIRARIQQEIGPRYSYLRWLAERHGHVYEFEEGQQKQQEFLDSIIAEFEAKGG